MDEMACLIVPLVIVCVLSGPVALIVSMVALNKVREIREHPEGKNALPQHAPEIKEPIAQPIIFQPPPEPEQPKQPPIDEPQAVIERIPEKAVQETLSLEQRIGIRWVLIAGVIVVFIAAGFFLKFAYDNYWIGPWGRIGIAVVAGFISLAIGEITRRRGYGIAAKGTTALGFAILYAADFSAYRLYELIGATPAFTTAIAITAAAMTYAVVLDEVVAAFLALLGGFITPVIVSKGENMPMPLFGYVLVLSIGAMLCAYRRKWRAVNLLAFIGTFVLYCGWFEEFFRPQLHASGTPEQLAIALGWLGIFFAVFLVLPLLYGLVNRVKAGKDDVWLVVINAAWVFFYLWTILFGLNRPALALCAAGLSAAHLAMTGVVLKCCREDKDLRSSLLVIGLAFLTTAIPLYWQMNAAILGWAIEGAILVFVGIRYRSILTQIGGAVALGLASAKLVWQLPLHTDAFRLVINPDFGIWVFAGAILWLCHFFYRKVSRSPEDSFNIVAQFYYVLAVLVLFSAATLEWAAYCKYNLLAGGDLHYISRGQSIIFSAALLLFILKPICPRGQYTETFMFISLITGVAFVACSLVKLHTEKFLIFINWDFATIFVFIMATFGCQIKYRLNAESDEQGIASQLLYIVLGTLFVAAIAAEWYWHCVYNLKSDYNSTLIRGQIIVFSLALLGFVVRPICPKGTLSKVWATGLAVIGSLFAVIMYSWTHEDSFIIFANWTFAASGFLIASMFVSAHLLNHRKNEEPASPEQGRREGKIFAVLLSLLAIDVLWIVLSEEIYEYWRCRDLFVKTIENWHFIASMWMSVAWAIYGLVLLVIGFWRKLKMLRYFGLFIFGLLLLKAFIIDMSEVSTIYRIMAFLATGVTLVGVSYLYQFLKKKGYFDTNLTKV